MVIVQAFTFQTPFASRLIRLNRAITISSSNTNRTTSIVRNYRVKVGLIHASRSSESRAHKHVPMSPTTGPVPTPINATQKYEKTLSSCIKLNITVLTICSFYVDVDPGLNLYHTVIHICTSSSTTYTIEHYFPAGIGSKIV